MYPPSIVAGPIVIIIRKLTFPLTRCPSKLDAPVIDDAAKFVPTATLVSIFNTEIIAGKRILPRSKPTSPPTNPIPNPMNDSAKEIAYYGLLKYVKG
jgi:hypothetical protein